jgi:hypothetical protein
LSIYDKIKSFGVTISRANVMYLWLHLKSAMTMDVIVWMYRYYVVDMLNMISDGLTPVADVPIALVWRVLSRSECPVV